MQQPDKCDHSNDESSMINNLAMRFPVIKYSLNSMWHLCHFQFLKVLLKMKVIPPYKRCASHPWYEQNQPSILICNMLISGFSGFNIWHRSNIFTPLIIKTCISVSKLQPFTGCKSHIHGLLLCTTCMHCFFISILDIKLQWQII